MFADRFTPMATARTTGHSCTILSEDRFASALSIERRRSERSGNSFLLALLHLDGLHQDQVKDAAASAVAPAVLSAIRETDIPGWYKQGRIFGVIFTELRDRPKQITRDLVDARIRRAVSAALPAGALQKLCFTYHFYPENGGAGAEAHPVLYPWGEHQRARNISQILKRGIDILGSVVALIALSPLFLLIALCIRLNSKGPVLFKQVRVGQGGRAFTFLKFRSMHANSDPSMHREYVTRMIAGQNVAYDDSTTTGLYKILNDPRITAVGRILRRTSMDELPQFLNVLMGDMSLIGPRPPLPYEFEQYALWHRRRVTEVKPGMTGLWQVSGRSRMNFDEMTRLDLHYIRTWSLWLDMKILLKTPLAIVSGDGAY